MDVVLHPLKSRQLVFESQVKCSPMVSWNRMLKTFSEKKVVNSLTFLALGKSQWSKPIIEAYIYNRRALGKK
jgi:hypothetical protein